MRGLSNQKNWQNCLKLEAGRAEQGAGEEAGAVADQKIPEWESLRDQIFPGVGFPLGGVYPYYLKQCSHIATKNIQGIKGYKYDTSIQGYNKGRLICKYNQGPFFKRKLMKQNAFLIYLFLYIKGITSLLAQIIFYDLPLNGPWSVNYQYFLHFYIIYFSKGMLILHKCLINIASVRIKCANRRFQ